MSQKPLDIGSQEEMAGEQETTVSSWTFLFPPDTVVTSASELIDAAGREFAVQGKPALRPEHRPIFIAASARLISDLQT